MYVSSSEYAYIISHFLETCLCFCDKILAHDLLIKYLSINIIMKCRLLNMFLRFGTLALSSSGSYMQNKYMFEISHSYTVCVTLIIHLNASTGVFRNQTWCITAACKYSISSSQRVTASDSEHSDKDHPTSCLHGKFPVTAVVSV